MSTCGEWAQSTTGHSSGAHWYLSHASQKDQAISQISASKHPEATYALPLEASLPCKATVQRSSLKPEAHSTGCTRGCTPGLVWTLSPGAEMAATSGTTSSVPVKLVSSPALACSTISLRKMTSIVRGKLPAGTCTFLMVWQMQQAAW